VINTAVNVLDYALMNCVLDEEDDSPQKPCGVR